MVGVVWGGGLRCGVVVGKGGLAWIGGLVVERGGGFGRGRKGGACCDDGLIDYNRVALDKLLRRRKRACRYST